MSAMEFIRKAQMSNRFEIASSRLAQERAQSEEVKRFAAQMVQDHTRTTQDMLELMQRQPANPMTSDRGSPDNPTSRAGSGAAPAGSAGGSAASSGQGSGGQAAGNQRSDAAAARTGAAAAQGQPPGMTVAQGGLQAEGMEAEHEQMMQQLQSAQGREFDRLYIQQQVQSHQKSLDMFTAYAQQGEHEELKLWAGRTLPILQQHLQQAQQVQRNL
jgi:predicted outer membrane protein